MAISPKIHFDEELYKEALRMGKGNTAMKRWFREPERFADLFNGQIFEGRQIILPDELEPLDSETGIIFPGKNEKTEVTERRRDVFMRWKKGVNLVLLGCENQERIHYAMPVRNMLYDSLQYADQIQKIKKKNMKEKVPTVSKDEFLSGIHKGDTISPVLTVVFYYGESPWDASLRLHEMFPKDVMDTDVLKKYIPDYKINLIDAGNVHCVENFHSDLQQIFGMLKCRGNKRDLVEYIRKNQWYFRNVDEDTYHVIRELLHSERILKKEVSSANGEECVDMCKALEELYNDGYELGMSKGATDKSNEIIKNMLNLNVPIETIMKCTGASNEMILELMEKVNI